MRRFFVWSALAALVGLLIAGGGYWAYWTYYARFQPVTVSRDQEAIQTLLDEAGWISAGGGGSPVYIVGYRDSAAMQRYEREEVPKLKAAGAEVRIILFARPDREGMQQSTAAERATVAELWLTRDWSLYERWTATPTASWTAAGIPAADDNLARSAVVDAGQKFVIDLTGYLRNSGLQPRYPLILWRDQQGYLKACACTDPRSWVFIRDDLGAPDRIDADVPVELGLEPETQPEGAPPLDYPDLPPIPEGETAPSDADDADAPPSASPPAPRRPTTPPPAPKAQRQDDTTFY
ncbi:hypothetical protein [Brevundimonas sp.]|uniref:hypothetical protein n=1 Tax=Brevundimonas sp. TaxID=1871086 RepID=UPI003AF776B0